MVLIELHEKTSEYVQYRFYPWAKKDKPFGIVQVNLKDFKRVSVKDIPDIDIEYKFFAWNIVEENARLGKFPERDVAIWM